MSKLKQGHQSLQALARNPNQQNLAQEFGFPAERREHEPKKYEAFPSRKVGSKQEKADSLEFIDLDDVQDISDLNQFSELPKRSKNNSRKHRSGLGRIQTHTNQFHDDDSSQDSDMEQQQLHEH